jgi:hypothetical protein
MVEAAAMELMLSVATAHLAMKALPARSILMNARLAPVKMEVPVPTKSTLIAASAQLALREMIVKSI